MYGLFAAACPTNEDRADWAEVAANTFAEATYGGRTFTEMAAEQPDVGDDAYTALQDLITDVLHLARRHGWDPAEMTRSAVANFDEEEAEEAEEAEED